MCVCVCVCARARARMHTHTHTGLQAHHYQCLYVPTYKLVRGKETKNLTSDNAINLQI
jgi:hypothetical protein